MSSGKVGLFRRPDEWGNPCPGRDDAHPRFFVSTDDGGDPPGGGSGHEFRDFDASAPVSEQVADVDVLILGMARITKEVLDAAPRIAGSAAGVCRWPRRSRPRGPGGRLRFPPSAPDGCDERIVRPRGANGHETLRISCQRREHCSSITTRSIRRRARDKSPGPRSTYSGANPRTRRIRSWGWTTSSCRPMWPGSRTSRFVTSPGSSRRTFVGSSTARCWKTSRTPRLWLENDHHPTVIPSASLAPCAVRGFPARTRRLRAEQGTAPSVRLMGQIRR